MSSRMNIGIVGATGQHTPRGSWLPRFAPPSTTARSTSSVSTTTEIRISEVEIISMFTPEEASAEKNFAVMPGCERMPAPMSETLPIWSS